MLSDSKFELELRSDSIVTPVEDIPEYAMLVSEVFTPLNKLKTLPVDARASKFVFITFNMVIINEIECISGVKGEVTELGEKTDEVSKRGTEYARQDMYLTDGTREVRFIVSTNHFDDLFFWFIIFFYNILIHLFIVS